jgi:RNA polymerase sigma-70 factor (ECF subfamily)
MVVQHGNRVYQLAYRLTRSRTDAEDVLQEVFFKLFTHWVHVCACGNLAAWITRVVTNASIDLLRSRKSRGPTAGPGSLAVLPASAHRPSRALEDRELAEKLHQALGELPPHQMASIVLFDHEGLKGKEIARILGVGESVVRTYIFQARRKIRDRLTPYLRGGDR